MKIVKKYLAQVNVMVNPPFSCVYLIRLTGEIQ